MDAALVWTLVGLSLVLSVFAISLAIVAFDVVREVEASRRGTRGPRGPMGPPGPAGPAFSASRTPVER